MWGFRSTTETAPVDGLTIDTRVWTRWPRRLGSKRVRFRASVFGTQSVPFAGSNATS
jgi:hypothetical protein